MQCGLPRRDVGTADDVLRHGQHRLRVLQEHVTSLAALQLDVSLQTVHLHVHATPPSARSRPGGQPRHMSVHTNLGLDAVRSTLYSGHPLGVASDKLGGSRQVVRRASTTEEVTLMKGHHGAQLRTITVAQLLSVTEYEMPFGPVVAHQVHVQTPLAVLLKLQPRAKRAADGVTEAVRAGPSCTRSGAISF